jgi:phosphate starvation-inducible membrane PsiE
MPVRFLIYIAITALTRHLVDLVTHPSNIWDIVGLGATTLVLAVSVLVVRFASSKYPNGKSEDIS